MPTFGGVDIFGPAAQVEVLDNPRATQLNEFFGVDGHELLDGGSRGRVTVASVLQYGRGAAGLAAVQNATRQLRDNVPRVLIDSLGQAWANVVLVRFAPEGRIYGDDYGNVFQAAKLEFRHLTDF